MLMSVDLNCGKAAVKNNERKFRLFEIRINKALVEIEKSFESFLESSEDL